jgi:hypothetical protein
MEGVLEEKSTDWRSTEGLEERKEDQEDWIIGC